MIDIKKILADTHIYIYIIIIIDQNTYFLLTNNPFFWGFFNRKKEMQKIKRTRKLEVSSCFALVLEKTERKGKTILNTTGLFSPKTMQYFTEYHEFGLRVFIFGIQDYIDSVEL